MVLTQIENNVDLWMDYLCDSDYLNRFVSIKHWQLIKIKKGVFISTRCMKLIKVNKTNHSNDR